MEPKHYLDDLPAYALGALNQAETLRVEAHLTGCAACRAEFQDYLRVVEQLPLAVALSDPAAEVKTRLLARATLQSTESPRTRSMPSSSGWRARLAGFFGSRQLVWRLAGLAVMLLLVVSNLSLWQQVNQLQRPASFHIVQMAGTANSPEARGVLVISDAGLEGTLVVEHMPTLDSASAYQLWLIKDGQRTSGGVFETYESGYGHMVIHAPASLLAYDSFGVTIEPAGGSPGPTGDKVLGGSQ